MCKIKDIKFDINCFWMDVLEVLNSLMFCFFVFINKVLIVD